MPPSRPLPPSISSLASSLPPPDQETLAYLLLSPPDLPKSHLHKVKPSRSLSPHLPLQLRHLLPSLLPSSSFPDPRPSSSSSCLDRESPPSPPPRSPLRPVPVSSQREGKPGKKQGQFRSHKLSFGCYCFQCYKSFWSRWDASPNRQLIHEIIDLYEEHIAEQHDVRKNAANGDKKILGRSKSRRKEKLKNNKDGKVASDLEAGKSVKDLAEQVTSGNDDSSAEFEPTAAANGLFAGSDTNPVESLRQNTANESSIGSESFKEASDNHGGDESLCGRHAVSSRRDHYGAAKSNQVVPVDFEDEEIASGPEAGDSEDKEAAQQIYELRAGFLYPEQVSSRSLMRRVLPDVMGFVAERVWNVWSPRTRNTAIALY